MLFGDSITQQSFAPGGWGARLADAYARRADVVLRGYSGYNTEWALPLVPGVFLLNGDDDGGGSAAGSGGGGGEGNRRRRPNALVTIFFGANDAALPDRSSARQHVPLERFKRNLAQLARAALETVEPGGLVLLISCPPVDESARARKLAADQGQDPASPPLPLPERTNEAARAYSRAAAEVAESLSSSSSSPADAAAKETTAATTEPPRVAFLDLWEELGGASFPAGPGGGEGDQDEEKEDPRRLFSDGLHLSAELGSLRVFGSVAAAIAEHRPHLSAAELPLDFPEWSAMEPCPR